MAEGSGERDNYTVCSCGCGEVLTTKVQLIWKHRLLNKFSKKGKFSRIALIVTTNPNNNFFMLLSD